LYSSTTRVLGVHGLGVGSWELGVMGVDDDSDWSKCFVQYDERGQYQSIQIVKSSMASLALTLRSDLSRSIQ
jgi:hypothetical protein